eukprot:CAMPEP_0194030412 /NCGR_PEP_ID=MMETSP0009_2-20130614/3910_1 /TAXON_ID=210454 /ORGANISM="Grammatophora oceanica, Strain CCMP 410" /LENGTH=204 /DNA_ID=CAMNT_0038670355 /DNA_START=44 /DNA_END=658 /DNA_ORIENTATION=-
MTEKGGVLDQVFEGALNSINYVGNMTVHNAVLDDVFEEALHFINYVGSWILLLGVAVALFNFGLLVVQYVTGFKLRILLALTQPNAKCLTLDHIKLELARIVSFSLLLLVAADVLETLLKPMHDLTMEDLYKMALVGGIRTTLAYFLGKETEEIMHHIAHHDAHDNHEEHHEQAKASSNEVVKGPIVMNNQPKAGQKKKKQKKT